MPAPGATQPQKLFTIGGSDSGGAAGIQADLKTWTALAGYGMSAITAVTAQNSVEVKSVYYVPPPLLSAQIDAVLTDYGADAIKTGFIGRSDLVEVIGQKLKEHEPQFLIVDPVLVDHKKQVMFSKEVITAYRDHLLPLATLVTPNWAEALVLSGLPSTRQPTSQNQDKVLHVLHEMSQTNILITGIEEGDFILDIFFGGGEKQALKKKRIETDNRHGSGDTLSAAVAAYLAQGYAMFEAIRMAQEFTTSALQAAKEWHLGQGHGPLAHFWGK